MRLCDFLDKLHGDLTVKIFTENEDGYFNELLREDKIKNLDKECTDSFNILVGFNNKLWEMQVVKWNIYDNVINVAISK